MRIQNATPGKTPPKASSPQTAAPNSAHANDTAVATLLEHAIKASASSIHIEPRATTVHIRYRIDGLLQEADSLPKNILNNLAARVKNLSGLNAEETRVPQEGRFKMRVGGDGAYTFALYVSTLPISEGEKIVIRLREESGKIPTLPQLGLWGEGLAATKAALKQTQGLIVVAGPHDAGTSTTLYSILNALSTPSSNISTIEEPITHHMPSINQTAVNQKIGLTFASGLRALLHQDPNVIMVDDIRDSETAALATQAALTGRLVCAALRTNDATQVITRLTDMKIEPYLVASSIHLVIGQRLVRVLCNKCKQSYKPDKSEVQTIFNSFALNTKVHFANLVALEAQAIEEGVGSGKTTALKGKTIVQLWRPKPGGCAACNHTSYKGRIGIYEVLECSEHVQKLIAAKADCTIIRRQALLEGMVPMHIDGFIKILRGQTTAEEVLRATSNYA